MDDLKVRKRIRRVVAHHRDGARLFATTVAACAKPVQASMTALPSEPTARRLRIILLCVADLRR